MIPLINPSEKSDNKVCRRCGKEEFYAKELCYSCYRRQWLKNNPEKYEHVKKKNVQYTKELWKKHPELKEKSLLKFIESKTHKELKESESLKKQTCKILREHAEEMKDDPEHLTTEFMQKLIGIKCKKPKVN